MAARHITIGPEFFIKAKNDYANWHWAIVREFFQNCIDCGSTKISVSCDEESGMTRLAVINNGTPMDEDILINKLLSLGSSGKNFEGENTGGFGKAKEILYFCHANYQIHSGSLLVDGVGAAYDLRTDCAFFPGTMSIITIEGSHSTELLKEIGRFIGYTQWDGSFEVNGVEKKGELWKGSPRRDLGFAKVYTNRSFRYLMIVRMNGTPMFTKGISLDRCVIVELKGKSDEVLMSNRDGLVEPYSSELSDFVTELAVDKRSALKNRRRGPRYIQYRGKKMCHQRVLDVAQVVDLAATAARVADAVAGTPAEPTTAGVAVSLDPPTPPSYREEVETGGRSAARDVPTGTYRPSRVATLGTNFILKNETDLKIPAYYDPGSGEFSDYSRKLVRIWGRLMVEMHRLFDVEDEFSIGFIFDDGDEVSTEAEHENGDFGRVYYLNPCVVVEQNHTYSKSFKKRFKLTERDRLVMIALHEFVHGLGLGWHDERYANKLTDMAAKVMKERKRFNWCFN